MAPSERAGKSVFCGNIPYNLTEEQVKEILSTAGAVERFRLMVNPETGRPKGYGFADFADADSAASAVRNLNDYEIMGRKIRVDWPHNNEKDSVPPDYSQIPGHPQNQDRSQMHQQSSTTLPPFPPGSEIPAGLTCPDAISRTLAALPAHSLLDVLNQMKALVMTDPARATELLRQAPQLAYAIFQALLLMNLVDQSALAQVVEQTAQPVVAPPPAPQVQPAYAQYPGSVPTPPVQPAYMAPQAPAAEVPLESLSPNELLQRVLSMPQSAVDALPPGDREQVIALRAAYMR
ncbi:Nucleotide-binding, alpha-beta plait [Ascosphaera apis ARSEF 7405]|uniref:Nucleotide-binding, alpha-beta plait n=1 Tax=Ascosphaera apis ARSEF 7405 TaxID=392613 RepID=A0A167ZUV5_9EURO|nr:Nucleotide-binding, alpha-beta plait [Ascosphaera apis ARSEF 7405]